VQPTLFQGKGYSNLLEHIDVLTKEKKSVTYNLYTFHENINCCLKIFLNSFKRKYVYFTNIFVITKKSKIIHCLNNILN